MSNEDLIRESMHELTDALTVVEVKLSIVSARVRLLRQLLGEMFPVVKNGPTVDQEDRGWGVPEEHLIT